jgi:hypothetical protein
MLFNFVDATSASISVENWEGSILAPDAALTISGGNIEGFVYVASFNGGGELHNFPTRLGSTTGWPERCSPKKFPPARTSTSGMQSNTDSK